MVIYIKTDISNPTDSYTSGLKYLYSLWNHIYERQMCGLNADFF